MQTFQENQRLTGARRRLEELPFSDTEMTEAPVTVLLTHLGDSTPYYIKDCIHQLRLVHARADLRIVICCNAIHRGTAFWSALDAELIFVEDLEPTEHHFMFKRKQATSANFRDGFWSHVRERFFYMEECMRALRLESVFAMEYDVLVYRNLRTLLPAMKTYANGRLAYVMDTFFRGHPGFMFLPSADAVAQFNSFMIDILYDPLCILKSSDITDMELLYQYRQFYPNHVCTLPLLPASLQISNDTEYTRGSRNRTHFTPITDGAAELGVLFDSAVIGQGVGGIDPRNTGGQKIAPYKNESAFYSILECAFSWKKGADGLWRPYIHDMPLVTIHMHSKALFCFLSDRSDAPAADYDVQTLLKSLLQN
jgi:hypothetical protein